MQVLKVISMLFSTRMISQHTADSSWTVLCKAAQKRNKPSQENLKTQCHYFSNHFEKFYDNMMVP